MDTLEEIIKKQYQDLCKSLDVNINFLSFHQIKENEHTNLLAAILRYKLNGEQSFIKSFLNRAFSDLTIDDEWDIYTLNNYIDCRLEGKSNAIIIENKVCGATDQHNQIKSYVDFLRPKYNFNNIYVIYLTAFGGTPNQDSLPDSLKDELKERYAEINYNDDLLPWIEKDVLQHCPYREQSLICSLRLYVGYLRRMLGIDVFQQTVAPKMRKVLSENGLSEYKEIKRKLSEVHDDDEYSQILNIVLRQMEKENVYYNDANVAYNLKWLMRNNPTPEYKLSWIKRDYSPFNSIGYFTSYGGIKYVQLSTNLCGKFIRIHMVCKPEGIKTGPYVLTEPSSVDTLCELWRIKELEQDGFELRDNVLTYPFDKFDLTTPLTDVAIHIERMIKKLNKACNVKIG